MMRKANKNNLLEIIGTLYEAHDVAQKYIAKSDNGNAVSVLSECQNASVSLVEIVKRSEGDDCVTVGLFGKYNDEVCNARSLIDINENTNGIKENLDKALTNIENSIKNDIKTRLEIVFMPYKASMWDSLESVWKAADKDPDCDAYVVPIPYYDRNPDHSLGQLHYEGGEFPDDVPTVSYQAYNLEKRRPDVIYIHNPYDDCNFVTSVAPRFYSRELKKYTDTLVYVPYYSTSGGMNEGQAMCPAYNYADYIVIQTEKYRSFFDPSIPDEKFLSTGSPKFDRTIRICSNPPAPPAEWIPKLKGKKVYFYNTSISGMLENTAVFIRKIKYVFECFSKRDDVCLLWRPHPLLEATFKSMRPQFMESYQMLKSFFIKSNFGIYDDTPDISYSIAICDAYIGDEGTSVTSLFGVAGKPIFILNNWIDSVPGEDDWGGNIIYGPEPYCDNASWAVTCGNKLFYSKNSDYKYRYVCDLSEYYVFGYFLWPITVNKKTYICPENASEIIAVDENGEKSRIKIKKLNDKTNPFYGAISSGKYIFLIPYNYPAIVRYNTENNELIYLQDNMDIITGIYNGEKRVGGYCEYNGYIFITSPTDNRVLAIDSATCREQVLTTGAGNSSGNIMMASDGTDIWFLPFSNDVIVRWNPETGDVREYSGFPEGFICNHYPSGSPCMERPFFSVAFYRNDVYFAPAWGNMYIKLDKFSGKITKWIPPFEMCNEIKNGYFSVWLRSLFIQNADDKKKGHMFVFSAYDRRLYKVNLKNNSFTEIKIDFDVQELRSHESGFSRKSDIMRYSCDENAFNSLSDFLDGNITGKQFNREEQLKCFGEITANNDGTCGEKTHMLICRKILNGGD